MHRLFPAVIAPLIEAAEPRTIVEVGAGAGRLTRRLLDAADAEAVVHAIDPEPGLDPELCEAEEERLVVHAQRSGPALRALGPVDLALLDGEPNWHTVYSDLKALTGAARRARREAPLIAVHHVHWPYGRRDGYYEPQAIPSARRRDHTDLGLVPGRRDPAAQGLRLVPWAAVKEFEPRSGVLTAIEDFLAGSGLEWTLVEVPGFHGVAVIAEARLLERLPEVAAVLERLGGPRFLARQARRAESARLAAEVELAAARLRLGEAPAPAPTAAPESEPAMASPEPAPPPPEAAQERARREAMEWRLEQLEEDLAKGGERLEALAADRDAELRSAAEVRVRLEQAARELSTERADAGRLRARLADLERQLEEREGELREAADRARLAEGRVAHGRELAAALTDERDRLRADAERSRAESEAARGALEEISGHLRRAREGRIGRALRRLRGDASPAPLEQARAAAERSLPAPRIEEGREGDDVGAALEGDGVR